MKNVFYFKNINSVGGVESWLYYLSKKYDFTFYYKTGSPEQIKRLAKNVEVRKYRDEIIECENFFCNYNPDILDNVKAKNYINMIHCDYKQVWFSPNSDPRFNINIAVSKLAGESFKEVSGKEYELLYNPVIIDIPKVEKYDDGKLHLISATRLTKEKGLNRMKRLANLLEINGIDYEWIVYTNRLREAIGNNVIYKDFKLDIIEDIAKADYLVQLSDCEAFCYSIVESLMAKTPVIVTDLPVLKELGVEHGVNAVICDFNMKKIDIDLIKKKSLKFDYKPPESDWGKYLDKKGEYNADDMVEVRTLRKFWDIETNIHYNKNNLFKTNKARASYLESLDYVVIIWS